MILQLACELYIAGLSAVFISMLSKNQASFPLNVGGVVRQN